MSETNGSWGRPDASREELVKELDRQLGEARRASAPAGSSPLLSVTVEAARCVDVPIRGVDEESDGNSSQPVILRIQTQAGRSVDAALTVGELRYAMEMGASALDLAAFAVAARSTPGAERAWRPHIIGRAEPQTIRRMAERLDGLSVLERDGTVAGHLDRGRSVLLYGSIGAGKTTSALRQAYNARNMDHTVVWLDLTDPNDGDESVARALLEEPTSARTLIVIDNLQANRSAAAGVSQLVRWLRDELGLSVVILATALSVTHDEPLSTHFVPVVASGGEVIDEILASRALSPEEDRKLRSLANENAFVAAKALEIRDDEGAVPEQAEFAAAMAEKLSINKVRGPARSLLYQLASLALFEIEVTKRYADTHYDVAALRELTELKIVGINDESYSIGHRTHARIIVEYARENWRNGTRLDGPDRIAANYLQRANQGQMRATLDKITLVSSVDPDAGGTAEWIASAWRSLDNLGRRLEYRVCHRDNTWGDDTASAIFASRALKRLDLQDAWQKSADYIRTRWNWSRTNEPPVWSDGKPTADLAWFEGLRDSMEAEDTALAKEGRQPRFKQPAEDLDVERACRTWMLGALLYHEASAIDRDLESVKQLLLVAETVKSDDGTGAFYPRRAPWVTAQVVLGLCEAGLDKRNGVVRRACEWLRTDTGLGGPFDFFWESGSGDWVSDQMTTALCVNALLKAGYPDDDRSVQRGYEYLRMERGDWIREGREMDLAVVVEAALRKGGGWRDFSTDIMGLFAWALSDGNWGYQPDPGRPGTVQPGANSKIPFIAAQLADMVSTALRRELPGLLYALSGLDVREPAAVPAQRAAAAARRPDPDPVVPEPDPTVASAADYGVNRILGKIDQEIELHVRVGPDLKGVRNKREIESTLKVWRDRRSKAIRLKADLVGGVTDDLLDRLNVLGREVHGDAWDTVPGVTHPSTTTD